MIANFRVPSQKLVTLVGLSLVAIIIVHQLSFNDRFALSGEPIRVVNACPRPAAYTNHESVEGTGSYIPNLVHQIWKTRNLSTYPAQTSHASWIDQAESMNYTVKLWTDNDIQTLIRTKYAWLLSTYDGYPHNIQRADMARLVVVHSEGGIYADLDVYPESVSELQCLQHLGLQGIFAPTAGNGGLSNHFFMAEKGSEFLQWALYEAKLRGGSSSNRILLPYLRVFWSTGPLMVTSAFRRYSWMYNPSDHELGMLDASYGRFMIRHAAGRSWHGLDGYLLNYIADNVKLESPWVRVYLAVAILALGYLLWRFRWRLERLMDLDMATWTQAGSMRDILNLH
ncbi:hypothetical protein ED733_005219 [Metarhizium rileyi]|uniref:Glycosyltransferase, DXD sugar-binding motif protein n=1 Tax=Metarhizium rileyi (strain RCEF 4871) TaxID=1649241 RepID=A0A5C6GNB5_METRR|nr:hypothetical protein ED733_005219 [Metarhizium rileyi]